MYVSFEDWENPGETEKLVNRLQENQKDLPMYMISDYLLNHKWEKLSLQLKTEKINYSWWFRQMLWAPLPVEDVSYRKLWNIWKKNEWNMFSLEKFELL